MSSNRSDSRRKTRLSRAEIKAYESRRAEERRRLALHQEKEKAAEPVRSGSTAYVMTRDDEFGVIKSDLVRLGWIIGVLTVLLVGATIIFS